MRKSTLSYFCNALLAFAFSTFIISQLTAQCSSGTISGTVFSDVDYNGTHNNSEPGLSGIGVRVYNANGQLVGQALSSGNGNYSVTGLDDGNFYIVRFDLDDDEIISASGPDNGTDVQKVVVPFCNADLAIATSENNCSQSTELILSCFVNGVSGTNNNQETLIGIQNNFTGSSPVKVYATQRETGSVWGLAYDQFNDQIFSAAFVKQNTALGSGGHDAIYKTTLSGSPSTALLTTLSSLGQSIGSLVVSNPTDCNYGNQVGRIGLGGMDLNEEGSHLYVVNLHNRTLVSVNVNNPIPSETRSYAIPNPGCTFNDYRPFAVNYHNGAVYVGVTCTAETSKDDQQTSFHIYKLNINSGNFSLEFSSDFKGGHWNDQANWKQRSYWLTDLEFTNEGNMIISLSDRIGHRYCTQTNSRLDEQFGELLMVARVNGEWVIENNGTAGNLTGSGVNNNDGPGGGEFFGDDFFPADPEDHHNITTGSIAIVPGTDNVVSSVFDPQFDNYSGGLHSYSTINGSKISSQQLYNRNLISYFGKASGFGDIVTRCGAISAQLGNYVWSDDNCDGIQNANESGLAGLKLNLYDSDCNKVSSTTTDASGHYYFDTNVYAGQAYSVALDSDIYDSNTGSYTFNNTYYFPTIDNSTTQINSNLINSSVCFDYPSADFLLKSGNNTTIDLGLKSSSNFDLALMKVVTDATNVKVGDIIDFKIQVYNQGGITADSYELVDYLTSAFVFDPALNPGWIKNGNMAKLFIDDNLAPGQSAEHIIRLQVVQTNNIQDYINTAEISGATDINGDVNNDSDSTADDDWTNDNGGEANSPTDNQIDNDGSVDEDDEDPAGICVLDLALRNVVRNNKTYKVGDIVTFDITVYNQGNIATTSFDIASQYPNTLDFVATDNQGWTNLSSDIVTTTYDGILQPGESVTTSVQYRLNDNYKQDEVIVLAEISGFISSKPGITVDFDSTPDSIFGNDNGGEVNTSTDDMIDDDGTSDEDDEDPASISSYKLDLALMITTERDYVEIGDVVDFTIELYNQGETTVSSVMVMNYIPEGVRMLGDNWEIEASDPSNQMYYRTINFANGLAPNEVHYTTLSLEILEDAEVGYLVDYAEIGVVTDMAGNDVSAYDIDSKADKDMSNDAGGVFRSANDNRIDGNGIDDEDDQDPAGVYLASIEIKDPCTCKGNATDPFDGQFDELVTVTAPSGQVWYIDFLYDIFSTTSAAPPATPTPFMLGAMGFNLIEQPLGNGVSEYLLDGIIVDGIPYSVRVTNGEGAFLQISGGGDGCVYTDPIIESDGLSAVCGGRPFTYCIDAVAGCTSYAWTLSGGGSISGSATGTCVTVDWASATGGPFTLMVSPTCTDVCVAPGIAIISVGSSTGPMSCRGEINVSLDDNCRTQLEPSDFLSSPMMPGVVYQLMVTDHHGNSVPNGILTEEHLWTSLMVKVINPCDGNSCWSTVNVEDKLPPVIQCDDITMPCYELDNYRPLVADNCSTATFELIGEKTRPLECDDNFIKEVTRSYIATDGYGNVSPVCNQIIRLERIEIDEIVYPDSLLIVDNTNLVCNDSIYDVDGRPRLDLTGVPTLAGRPLIPAGDYYCNFYIDYEDFVITTGGCVTKIMRTFTAYEDWCSSNEVIRTVQIIEVIDDEKPMVTCPPSITISTDGTPGCDQEVTLPLPTATDNCSETFIYDISTADGFFPNVTTSPTVSLGNGVNMVTYNVYDECGNIATCDMSVRVLDEVSPVAICDGSTTVSLRSNGTAKAFAHTFDDGSYDDCALYKFLTKRVNSNCDCNRPVFDDMTYLGDRNGRLYYISNYKTNAFRAFSYSNAFGGMILREESCEEKDWVYEQVNRVNSGATYYVGISDDGHQGRFTFTNHADVGCDAFLDPTPANIGDNVIVDADGNYVIVDGNTIETFYVVELSDPCGFSDEVLFCCEDLGDQMVVFRAIDKEGRFNDCMVTVSVQDKVAPIITCPPNIDIDCDTPLDFNNLDQFGIATAVDSCTFTITEEVIEGVNSCGQGMIMRTFTASDNGGSSSCTQDITLVNPTPFDLNSVDLPEDYFTDLGCDSGDLQPENLPEGFGLPQYDVEACAMIGITFKDQTFTFTGPDADACLKILRTYTIIDWCQSDDPGYTPIVHEQTIKVSNTVGPEILSGCDDLTIRTNECDFGNVSFTVVASDDCTDDDRLRNFFELRLSDGTVFRDSTSSNSYTFNGKLPIGRHIAFISFSDLCGNVTTCSKKIDVINVKAPTAACKDGLSIGLVPMDLNNDGISDNEMACIFPEMINASSTHVCGLPIKLSFSSDTTDVKKIFDCTNLGLNEVQLWVTLCNPGSDTLIQSFCTITVDVQDNNNVDFCPKFDLALRKTISATSTAPYQPGDDVTFDINVINQGNVSAFNIGLVDYIPAGLTLNDTDWTEGANGIASLNVPIPFLEDSTDIVVPITFTIDANNPGSTITNLAEISSADNDNDPNNEDPVDEDSNPDSDPNNDGTITDDAVNNENDDEDDFDPADLVISVFDLALTKVINIASSPGPYNPGDDVSFIITAFNQGNVDATDVVITDYIPTGFTFNAALSPGYTLVGNNVQTTIANLAGGASMSTGLTLTINANYTGGCLINSAEITSADNEDNLVDQDSPLTTISNGNNPELASDNDIADDSTGGTDNANDQDDYDPAKVDVICDLAPLCNSAATLSVVLDGNGTASIDVSQIDIGSVAQCDNSTIITTIDVSSFDCSDAGSGNIVTLTIADSNGQSSTCQTDVTVIDDEDPVIACQDIMTTLDDDGMIVLEGFVIVTSASDNCGVVDTTINTSTINLNTIDCTPQNATATVTDQFGNTATCTFMIAIENNPPMANCTDVILVLNNSGEATLSATQVDNVSTDDCTDNLTLEINQTEFTCIHVGVSAVELTVTDASGLSSTCRANVTVIDNTPPTALCSDFSVNVDANGNAVITTTNIDNGSSDLCSPVSLELNQVNFDCTDKGNNAVILTVTDASDNSSTCSAIVTVGDIIPPTVTCIPDFTMQLDDNGMTSLSETHFIASDADNCDVTSRAATPTTFTCDDKAAPVAVTVTVTDACNNSAQCTVNVTVEDNIDPTCALIPNLTFAPDVEISVADVLMLFDDNCATASSSSTITPSTFTCDDLGTQTVVVVVNDDCGNSGQCAVDVTIEDQTEPVCVANDISVCLDDMGLYELTPADSIAITNGTTAGCDVMLTTTFSQSEFDCNDTATPVNLTVTLITSSGATSTCNSIVTVIDKTAPTVTCVPDVTLVLNNVGQVILTPGDIIATSNDNCPITRTIDVSVLNCNNKAAPTTVTATVTDASGNSSMCTTIVTVEDNAAPTCTLLTGLTFAPNVTITVADVFDTFSDNCATVSSLTTIAPDLFTCMQLGTQIVTVTVNDDCGNSGTCTTNVEIVDMDMPVCVANDITVCLDATGQYTLNQMDIDNITNGSSAGCDVDFTLEVDQVEFLCNDTNNPVTVTVTLTSGGVETTCTAVVTVEDKLLPTVTCVNDFTLDLNVNGEATLTPSMIIATADDNCSFNQVIDVSLLNCSNKASATLVTATVTDQANNTATCTTNVSVEDNMDPICTLTAGLVFPPNVMIEVADVLATFTDNCATVSSSSTIAPSIFDCSQLGTQMVTVTVNDDCGNSSTCSVDVEIEDSSVPTAVCQDITVSLDGGGMVMIEGVDVDGGSSSACGTAFTFDVDPDNFDCGDIGDNAVILTVTSSGGTSSTCSAVVTVEDIMPPVIVCPADVDLPCNSDISNLSVFGDPSASDNCDNNFTLVEDATTDVNLCNVGTVTRLFTATDNGGNVSTCQQVITINGPIDPIDDADIIAPPTPVTFNECFDPANIITDGPIVDTSNADCFSLSVSFTDNPDPSNLMCSGQFTRTWVVRDSCQSPVFVRTYAQTINLNDNVGPMITGPADVVIFLDSTFTDCDTFLMLPATVTDCVGGFTQTNNSPFALDNNTADASGTYSGGTTDVTITATDVCGSVSTFSYSVSIVDTTAFVKDCDKVIVTIQSNMMVDVSTSQTNADICSICPLNDAFTLSWSDTDPSMDIMTVDCSQVGITNYVVYLYSGNMLVDSCGNLLQVLDGGGFCNQPSIGEVAGRVITENYEEIEGVTVNLLGSEMPGIDTGTDGIYAFTDMPFGGSYDVKPSKNIDFLNGVSTGDIIAIQRHILGAQLLDSPYKIIAADVNNSKDVSTLDLIELRKLILGIKDEFSNNTSWRMVDAEHDFIDELNPFISGVPEDYLILDFNESMLVDFIGVKIGDVNNTVVANAQDVFTDKRNASAFEFQINEQKYLRGESQQITFSSDDLASIDGIQMSLVFDQDKVDLIGFIPHVDDLSIDHINVAMMDEGILNLSWNTELSNATDELFSVIVKAKTNSWTSELFQIGTQDYITPEVYSNDGTLRSIKLEYINDGLKDNELVLYQNLPNPWSETTMIKYYISNDDNVSLTVYDVNGKILLTKSMDAVMGLNSFELGNNELDDSGVMYYEVMTSSKKDIHKMILIK